MTETEKVSLVFLLRCYGFLCVKAGLSLQLSVKRVKTFKLHPNYNVNAKVKEGVKEFYDYDVALIQLQEDVQISAAVR